MIKGIGFTHEKFNFPCGEMHVKVNFQGNDAGVIFNYEKNEDIIELLLVCDAIKRAGGRLVELHMPYIPFGRQDRVNVLGECFSLKVFADLINGLGFSDVVVTDPHSDVSSALLNNCIIVRQDQVFDGVLKDKSDFWLVSPDAGALKKIYLLSKNVTCNGVVQCSKNRNVMTGEITGVEVNINDLWGKDCYIVDDICDGGRTFTEIAKILKVKNCGKIILLVTHGFFTKGLGVFDELIDEIYTLKGKIK